MILLTYSLGELPQVALKQGIELLSGLGKRHFLENLLTSCGQNQTELES